MIDTVYLEGELRSMKRWQGVMVALFGLNVFCAAHWIVTPHDLGVWWQVFGVVLNISASVLSWDTVRKGERIRAELRRMLARAREFNRIFQ